LIWINPKARLGATLQVQRLQEALSDLSGRASLLRRQRARSELQVDPNADRECRSRPHSRRKAAEAAAKAFEHRRSISSGGLNG
jgi:hypothetical protein